jgi:4-amino-4-deoxy-L-arabinose transferase-like glycosyltransferase
MRAAAAARGALALIVLLACLLAAGSWRVYSNTWDEPEHLAAGIELLDRGQYEYDTEHPPLGRIPLALGPYLAGAHSFGTPPPNGTQEGIDILYDGGRYQQTLTLARLGTLPFLAVLLLSTWLWARRTLDSVPAALFAVLLLASVPAVLGHAALASLDVAAAGTTLLALYWLQRWLTEGGWRAALIFGLTAGVAVGTKFSAIPFLGLALPALALSAAWLGRARAAGPASSRLTSAQWACGFALVCLAALVPLFLAYGPRAANPDGVALRFNWAVAYLLQQHGPDHLLGSLLTHLPLPRELKDLVNGIVAVKAHNDTGHLAYLLGHTSTRGWWYFYLVALAVKTPLPLLIAGSVGLAWLGCSGWQARDPWRLAPALLFVVLLAFASLFSRINIGIRHVLVLYPFLVLGGSYVVMRAVRVLPRLRGTARLAAAAALAALVLWQLSTFWSAYPDYLPYFNETVAEPERVLVDSDLDWGQDLKRLEQRAAALRIEHLWLAYRGTADLAREPLPHFRVLGARQRVSGWVAISALARTRNPADYAWLSGFAPLERIGKTIDLYFIP